MGRKINSACQQNSNQLMAKLRLRGVQSGGGRQAEGRAAALLAEEARAGDWLITEGACAVVAGVPNDIVGIFRRGPASARARAPGGRCLVAIVDGFAYRAAGKTYRCAAVRICDDSGGA